MQDYSFRLKLIFLFFFYPLRSPLWYSGLPYLLHVENLSEDVSIGNTVREIFLMCLCYSMSLEAISLPQRGSAEGVTLFLCAHWTII